MPKVNEIELISEELKRPKSRRRKKILKIVDRKFIQEIESEIIKINYYLTTKSISNKTYKPHTGDDDQPLRERVTYLIDFRSKLKRIMNI
jgi:hypothetical protein